VFSVRCPRHRRFVLLGPSDILALNPGSDGGFSLSYRCTCGYEGEWPPAPCEETWPGGLGVSPDNGRREPPRTVRMAG